MKKILLFILLLIFSIGVNAQINNDECDGAIEIIPGEYMSSCTMVTTDGITMSDVPNICGEPGYPLTADAWYYFTATLTAHSFDMNPGFEALYSGECGNLVQICDPNPSTSGVFEGLTIGETYFLRGYTSEIVTYPSYGVCIGPGRHPLTISQTEYSTEELVTDLLFDAPCAEFTNISSSTGTSYGTNGIATFERDGTFFPFENGIILSTGIAPNVSGTLTGGGLNAGTFGWPGDADIETIVADAGFTGDSYNATSLEFEFTALANTINFEYVFASAEYDMDNPSCESHDTFAILLTDLVSNETINIALVPINGSTISPSTISGEFSGCPFVNDTYIDIVAGGITNFNAYTMLMTASGTIIPDHPYHVKIVIADFGNNLKDSAVFLNSAYFSIDGSDSYYDEIESDNYIYVCNSNTTLLSLDIDPVFNIQWSHNGIIIDGATSLTYGASEGGIYSAHVVHPDAADECSYDVSIELTAVDNTPEVSDIEVEDDNNDGVYEFDIVAIRDQIIEDNGWNQEFLNDLLFFTNEEAAEDTTDEDFFEYIIGYSEPTYTNVTNPQTIYIRTVAVDNGCYSITPFTLTVLVDEVPAPTGAAMQTLDEGATLTDVVVTGANIQWYSDAAGENLLPPTTVVADGVTYYASQTIGTVESITFLAVTIEIIVPTPAPTGETVQYFFENATLADLEAEGENIQWYASLEATETLPVSTLLVNNTAYYASQTIDGLESEERLSVTAFVTSPAPEAEEEQTLPEGATLADLEVEGENIQWYDSPGETVPGPPDSGIPLPLTTLLVDGTTYYASQTIDGIESIQRTPVTVSLSVPEETPAPEGAAEQTFNQGATLAEIDIDGENIKWYATEESTEVLPSATVLIDDTTYYATQTLSGLESTDRLGITVNLILGDTDFAFSGLSYWPNPVKDILEIKNGEAIDTVVIYNLLGQRVALQEIHATTATVDFTSLEGGMYLVEVRSGNETKTFKVVKK